MSALTNPAATLLMLAFGPSRWRSLVGGVTRAEVEDAFPDREMLAVERADTAGIGWPMRTTVPTWYQLRRRIQPHCSETSVGIASGPDH